MKLVIFDIDGTLCHSNHVDDKCYINAFKQTLNIDIENTDWNSYKYVTDYYVTYDIISNELNIKPDDSIISKVIDAYCECLKNRIAKNKNSFRAIPGSLELVNYLIDKPDSFVTGVATGGFMKTAKLKLDYLGFKFSEKNIYCSGKHKTKQEMINAFISNEETNRLRFTKVFYVGDRDYDRKTANDLGIDFLGVDFDRNDKLKNLGVNNVITDYKPIEKFLMLL